MRAVTPFPAPRSAQLPRDSVAVAGMFGFAGVITENTMCIPDQHMACPRRALGLCSATDIGVGLSAELPLCTGLTELSWHGVCSCLERRSAFRRCYPWAAKAAEMSEYLKFEANDGIATIRLNRPEKLNAFTDDMLEQWLGALDECRLSEKIHVVVITGTGRAFTTGGDVEGFAASASRTTADIKDRVVEGIQRLPRKIAEFDKPVIAALNGFATAGGLDIALACDIRFAAETARFAETYVRMGLIPGAGGAYLLPRVVGVAKALEMLWSAEYVDAREAERIGLVNRVFPDSELMDRTYEFAGRVAKGAPLAVRLIKRVVRLGLGKDLATGLELAAANLPVVRSSEDHLEAIAAFKEKRQPNFRGK